MPGALGALRLIELTAASLCEALGEPTGLLRQVMSAQPDANPALTEALQALTSRLQLRQAAWGAGADPTTLDQIAALALGLP